MRNYMCARGAFHCIIHQVTCDGSWNVLGAYPLVRYLQSIEDARGTRQWAPGGAKWILPRSSGVSVSVLKIFWPHSFIWRAGRLRGA